MAQKVVAMEAKLLAVFTSELDVNVRELCRQLGISPPTFYKYRRRFEAEGPAGLVERSRAPLRSPNQISAELENEIVRLRKDLVIDNGAQAIAYHLANAGLHVPAVSTIHRVLVARGLVIPQPEKRPHSATRRFEWPRANDAWQIDATCWALANGKEIWVMDVLDDHSRVLVAARVCAGPSAAAAWDALSHGIDEWGPPARVMSDNGTCFTTRFLHGGDSDFDKSLRGLGIEHLLSSPGHPQTCGKLERSHQTTKRWLRSRPPARNAVQLQDLLDEWRQHYNYARPHKAAGGGTPAKRWAQAERAIPADPIAASPRASLHTVSARGCINWTRYQINIGRRLAGHTVLVVARDLDVAIVGQAGELRRFTVDAARTYQPSGRSTDPQPHP
jgi:transposase InsO family protein